jgi:hypothetical protein
MFMTRDRVARYPPLSCFFDGLDFDGILHVDEHIGIVVIGNHNERVS